MFNRKSALPLVFTAALVFGFAPLASADTISNLPNYDGAASFGPFPASNSIGTFTFTLPANQIVIGGTISGTFGNNDVPGTTDTSAPADLFIDNGNIEVAACDDSLSYSAACDSGSAPTSWSYTFTNADLSSLSSEFASGSVDLTGVQNGLFAVNAGSLTLDVETEYTPEPNALWLLGTGIVFLVLVNRSRFQERARIF
jgi:hypothetical protein